METDMGKSNGNGSAHTRDSETRSLPVKLTSAELLERGDRMADAEIKIEALKFERAAVSTRIKAQVELRAELAHTIESGTEQRDVRCAWIEDYTHNCLQLIRQDTGAEVETRAMTAADRQGRLGLDAVPREADEIIDDLRATAERLGGGRLDVEVIDGDTGEVFNDSLAVEMAKPRGPKMRKRVANPSKAPPPRVEIGVVDVLNERVDFSGPKKRTRKPAKPTKKTKTTSRHANA